MAFRLKSQGSSFKMMGSSPARNMKTGNYNQSFESPVKQKSTKSSEAQDQDKIFNDKGVHIGDYVNGKKVMHVKKSTESAHGQLSDAEVEYQEDIKGVTTNIKMPKVMNDGSKNAVHTKNGKVKNWQPHQFRKKESPIEQTEGMLLKKKGTVKRSTPPVKGEKLWYKINGKSATKAEYMAYENKPGGDEKGKQTNDPNASLAKQSGNKRK